MPARTKRRVVRQKAKGPVDPTLGQRVLELRRRRALTQAQLAGPDFTKAFISHVEHGRTRISLRAAGILATRLGVDVRELLAPQGRSDLQLELHIIVAESHLARGDAAAALESARGMPSSAPPAYRARGKRAEGRALAALARHRDAIAPLSEAVRLFRATDARELAIRAAFDLAYAHAALDESGAAVALLLECERAASTGEVVDRTLELKVHALLAGLFMRMGDLASADLQADRAAAIAEDVVDEGALDTLYASMLALRREQGDFEGALQYARKALHLHERRGREADAVHAWNNLAWVYIERGQYGKAEASLQKAERLRKERSLGELGHLQVTRAKLELARGHYEEALRLAEAAATDATLLRTSRAQALLLAAKALAGTTARMPKLREAFDRAIAAYKDEPARKRARVHEVYAEVLADRALPGDAYEQAQKALKLQRA